MAGHRVVYLLTPATYNVVMRDKAHTSCVLI